MSNLPLDQKKLVASTIKKAVQDGKPELSPQEFAGMLAFVVSVNTLSRIYDEGAYKEENENDIKSHLQKGINFVKRRRPAVEGAVRAYFSDYVDKLRFKTYFKRLMRGKRPWTFVDRVDELLTAMLPRLLRDLTLVQEIFSGRSLLTIRQLGVVIEEEGLQARMHKLASMTPSPGMAKEHNWIRKAGKLADVGVTEVEDSIASSFEAKDLASELQKIQTRLSSLDPSSQDAVELQERKQDILNSLEDMVDEAEDPSAIKAVISDAASQNPQHSYATDIGKELSLSPEQEEALLSRGKTIIAAGAGSGKTRVLAGKIVYHVKDLGLQPSEIVACSFTRKSSEELKRRITSYGVDLMNLDNYSSMGFGTTHSFAGKMLGHYANDYPYAGGGDKMLSNYENLRLLKLAIWQTMMKPKPRTPPEDLNLQDEDMTFFPNLPGEGAEEFGPAEEDDAKKERMRKFELALDAIRDYTEYSVDKYHNGRVPDWAEGNYNLVRRFRGADPADLTEKEKETLNRVFEKNATQVNLKWKGIPNYKLSAVQKARNFLKKGRKKSARGKSILSKKDKEKLEWKHKYYYNNPANKWFNLGLTDNDFMRGHGEDKEPIPKGELILFIDNQKGRLNAPGKVMEDVAGDENVQDYIEGVSEKGEFIGEESKKGLFVKSAVYGAYQWLLQNEEEVKEKRSHTDVLIDVSKMMIERPDILEKVQKRFKAIFVDEAQDLNPAQHLIFGLVSGTYDPITQEPKEDGEATADTYCLIGDDKQAIYEWRGADPNEFIEKSDAYSSGSGDFDTKLLTMNFRSGNSIVQAANNLIAHNNKQIKMECKANVDQKGEGRITEETLPTIEDCADYAASSIKDQIDNEDIDVSYDDFGVACRTTRELIYFTSSLISRGIPFRSKKHPFKGPVLSGLISMLSLMSPESRSRDEINEAVVKGVKSPDFGLSPYTMKNKLEDLARGKNYYTFFVEENGYRQVYRGGKWGERAERYANFLEQIYGKAEEFGPEGAVNFLLNYEGPYGSLLDSLVEKLKDDPEMIETILEENMDAEGATEDLIRDYAMQPLDPLRSVLDHFGDIDESVEYINTVVEKSKALSKTPDPNKPGYDEPAVSLDTVHGWKGLEAAHVFVPMYESQAGGFPHSRSVGDENLLEAERRLAYVAITRGEDRVTILRPTVSPFSESIPARTSRFVTEACIKTDTEEREKTSSVTARGKGLPEDLLDLYLNEDFEAFNEGVEMLEELEQNEENH